PACSPSTRPCSSISTLDNPARPSSSLRLLAEAEGAPSPRLPLQLRSGLRQKQGRLLSRGFCETGRRLTFDPEDRKSKSPPLRLRSGQALPQRTREGWGTHLIQLSNFRTNVHPS